MLDTLSVEALAHYVRGMTTMFFIAWTGIIFRHRHQNSMMMVMTIAISYVTFGYIKDIAFLFTPWMKHPMVEDMVSLIDLLCTPFMAAFFLEATRPGIVTSKRLLTGIFMFFLPIPAYLIFRSDLIIDIAYMMAFLVSSASFLLIVHFVISYGKFVNDNYSFTKDISVRWVLVCAVIYLTWMVMYYLCFNEPTWKGEVIFDLFSIVIWVILWLASRKHRVVMEMLGKKSSGRRNRKETKQLLAEQATQGESTEPAKPIVRRRPTSKEIFLTHALAKLMEEKVYLNPRLSLSDLALAIGTNKSYLSEFLNSQGTSFYDYINEYRIAEACRILDSAKTGERISIANVAARSGFNSLSSFNRYFYKIKEMSPTVYLRLCLMDAITGEHTEEDDKQE
ncbi:MAG: helix-turn-helix domain-containing protein [Bacteroides sp.]